MARINVFVFGLDRAGKTTLVTYFQEKKFIPQSPTIGVNISHLIFAGSDLTMEFTDVGGQKRFRNDWENYVKRPHVLVFVIDASDRNEERIQDGRMELHKLLVNPKVTGIPVLVLINKVDLDMVMQRETVEKKFGLSRITGREMMVYEVSAMNGHNIDAVLNAMTTMVLKDDGIEHFVNQQVKEQSKALLDRYRKFHDAGVEAHARGNLDQALASLTLAREIATNLFQLGVLSGGKDFQKLANLIARIERETRDSDTMAVARDQEAGQGITFLPITMDGLSTALQEPVLPAFGATPPPMTLPPVPARRPGRIKDITMFVFGTDATGMHQLVEFFTRETFKGDGITYAINVPDIVLEHTGFTFNDTSLVKTGEDLPGEWTSADVLVFVVDASDVGSFPVARRTLLSTLQKGEATGKTVLVLVNNFDGGEAKPQAFIDTISDIRRLQGINAGIFEVSLRYNYNLGEMVNFLASYLMKDKTVQQFVAKKMETMLSNYKEVYKALSREARDMEKKGDFQGAFNRVAKARLVQEELFKNNLPNAQKEMKKCDEWLSKLRTRSLRS